MKLEIDLTKPEEVAAGIEFLQLAIARKAPTLTAAAANVAEFVARTQVEEGEVFYVPPAIPPLPADSVPPVTLDPAQVFGGTPVADPLPSNTTVPAAPVVPNAPTTPTPGAASSVAAVERDAKGLPWDSRIHSSSKNKLANGCWKLARGKAPEYIASIEAELKGGAVSTMAPTASGVPSFPPVANAASSVVVPPPPPAPNADPTSFELLMTRISPQITAGVLPPTAVMEACKANGLQTVVGLQTSPQLVPLVWATLKATYPALV